LKSGVRHLIADGTVHMVRVKTAGSLGAQNGALGLLPDLSVHSCEALTLAAAASQ
jgi:hypothetical protein